jgi:putative protease
MNREAVKMYKSLGFSRVVMGREASLKEIAEIKDAVPDMEIECFVHGAMCIAYAGRCLMSAYLNGRSAQEGFCSHTCRWDYDVLSAKELAQSGNLYLREHKRPDDLFPIYEGDNFTAVLSSKDLCMIDHLSELKKAGVDSLKIEGRMKSIYYVAMVTRAYRKALDLLDGKITEDEAKPFIDELYNVSHRPFTTAFYFDKTKADETVSGASDSPYVLVAQGGELLSEDEQNLVLKKGKELREKLEEEYNSLCEPAKKAWMQRVQALPDKHLDQVKEITGWKMYTFTALNMIKKDTELEYVSPDTVGQKLLKEDYLLLNPKTGEIYNWVCDGHECVIYTKYDFCSGALFRARDLEYEEGKFRDTGR